MDLTQLKLPIAVVIAIIAQSGAGIWYFAKQSATIATMEHTIAQLEHNSAQMISSIEGETRDWVNLQRDVKDNTLFINDIRNDVDKEDLMLRMIREDVESNIQRLTALEIQVQYIDRDHGQFTMESAQRSSMTNAKDGLHSEF
jgi:hypothetical protein